MLARIHRGRTNYQPAAGTNSHAHSQHIRGLEPATSQPSPDSPRRDPTSTLPASTLVRATLNAGIRANKRGPPGTSACHEFLRLQWQSPPSGGSACGSALPRLYPPPLSFARLSTPGFAPTSEARQGRALATNSFASNGRAPLRGVLLAEAKGFEPLVPFDTAVFKTAAFDHSATPPFPGLPKQTLQRKAESPGALRQTRCPVASSLGVVHYKTHDK